MMLLHCTVLVVLFIVGHARDIPVIVGGNTTNNPGAVFEPQSIIAKQGDVVVFNFTQGNHTAIQALFASPCIPAHDVDSTVNGFNSGFRDAGNFSAITFLRVPVDNPNNTIWLYDHNTCKDGGVAGININETGWETLDGFARNAVRLNGSEATSSPSSTQFSSPTTTSAGATQTAGVRQAVQMGMTVMAPLLALAALSLNLIQAVGLEEEMTSLRSTLLNKAVESFVDPYPLVSQTNMSFKVDVSGISPSTSKAQLNDFFTFCGKISSIEHEDKSGKATIVFEKSSAAKTALMLNGGSLDGSTLIVTSDTPFHDDASNDDPSHPLDQTDKPRAGIAAEYLAKGYKLSDQVLQRAIELDHEKGISKKFLGYVHNLDKSAGERALGPEKTISSKLQETFENAQTQAKTLDEQKGISKTFYDYLTKALSSPFGQKVKQFYTTTSKQVVDIHEEARRIADQQKEGASAEAPAPAVPVN